MQVTSFDGDVDAIEFVELNYNDDSILEFNDPIVVRVDGKVIAVGSYSDDRIEIVTDDEAAAMAICKHFGDQVIKEVDCSNQAIAEKLQRIVDHPFANC